MVSLAQHCHHECRNIAGQAGNRAMCAFHTFLQLLVAVLIGEMGSDVERVQDLDLLNHVYGDVGFDIHHLAKDSHLQLVQGLLKLLCMASRSCCLIT